MLFSLLLCVRIKQFHGHMDAIEWRFLLAGGMLMSEDVLPANPSGASGWLDPAAWEQMFLLSKLHAFDGLYQDVVAHTDAWREYFDHQVDIFASFLKFCYVFLYLYLHNLCSLFPHHSS
jgi:dynein heavy chain